MFNGFMVTFQRKNEIRKFWIFFHDNSAREMTKGLGKIFDDYIKLFNDLENDGFEMLG